MYKKEGLAEFIEEMHQKVPGNGHIKRVFHEADGLFSVEMHIPAGLKISKHTHGYSHLSFLAKGIVEVSYAGSPKLYKAPACVLIPASVDHEITAVTDAVWYCTHATEESNGC